MKTTDDLLISGTARMMMRDHGITEDQMMKALAEGTKRSVMSDRDIIESKLPELGGRSVAVVTKPGSDGKVMVALVYWTRP